MKTRQLAILFGGLALLTAAGFGAWAYSAGSASAARATTVSGQDAVIDEVMVASGLKRQLELLPVYFKAGVEKSAPQQGIPRDFVARFEKAVDSSITAKGFIQRTVGNLKKNYDENRLQAVIRDSRKPLSTRMLALETLEPNQDKMRAFADELSAKPLSSTRLQLIQRYDAASKSSDTAKEIAFGSMNAMVRGATAGNQEAIAEFERAMAAQQPTIEAALRDATRLQIAMIYRDVSDGDLADYIKLMESEHNKWFMEIAFRSMREEFESASFRLGEELIAMAKANAGGATPGPVVAGAPTPAAAAAAAPEVTAGKPATPIAAAAMPSPIVMATAAAAGHRTSDSRANEDARSCLKVSDNRAVMVCAEKFR